MKRNNAVSAVLLRYSYPCGKILKYEGVLPEQDYELLLDAVRGEREFPAEKFKRYFVVASDSVEVDANEKEIRRYFWFFHNSDVRPLHCLAVPAIVKDVSCSKSIIVRNLYTKRDVEAIPLIDVKKGDYVIIHLSHIVDKIEKEDADKILDHLKKIKFSGASKRIDKILPAEVKSVFGNSAVVDDGFGEREVNIKLVKGVKVGDYVLVHYTHAFKVITEEEAKMFR